MIDFLTGVNREKKWVRQEIHLLHFFLPSFFISLSPLSTSLPISILRSQPISPVVFLTFLLLFFRLEVYYLHRKKQPTLSLSLHSNKFPPHWACEYPMCLEKNHGRSISIVFTLCSSVYTFTRIGLEWGWEKYYTTARIRIGQFSNTAEDLHLRHQYFLNGYIQFSNLRQRSRSTTWWHFIGYSILSLNLWLEKTSRQEIHLTNKFAPKTLQQHACIHNLTLLTNSYVWFSASSHTRPF